MEEYIGFVIVLFLLSMICERVADYLKHSLGEKNTWISAGLRTMFFMGDTIDKGAPNSEKEDARYFRILKINIICGFIISFSIHADLFSILQNIKEPWDALTWEEYEITGWWILKGTEKQHILLFIAGCLCTGLFISFGSKFWHDMLDLLLQVKNLKRKLVDERTYENRDTLAAVTEFINTPESRLSAIAVEQFGDDLEKIEGVISVGPGYMDARGGKIGCIEVHFETNADLTKVRDEYEIELTSGVPVKVPVNKIVTGASILHSSICGAGMLVANQSKRNGWGSAGCIVKKKGSKDLYLLSCYHVLSSNPDLSQKADRSAIKFTHGNKEEELGIIEEGIFTEKMDAAIALITNTSFTFTNDIILNPKECRKVTSQDVQADTMVRVYGGQSSLEKNGVIHHDSWKEPIPYHGKTGFMMEDLIVLTRRAGGKYHPLSIKGDSGSLVLDMDNKALGIIVGGNDAFSFAIKMTTIQKHFPIEFI